MFADCLTNTADLTQSTETARCSLGDVEPHGDVAFNIDAEVADTEGWYYCTTLTDNGGPKGIYSMVSGKTSRSQQDMPANLLVDDCPFAATPNTPPNLGE